jgi:hypothetical protein
MKIYNLAFLFLLIYLFASPITGIQQKPNEKKSAVTNLVFKSTDGGESWQDISEGLPGNWEEDVDYYPSFFANESGVYITSTNQVYHSNPNSSAPFWEKEIFPEKYRKSAPVKAGIIAFNQDGQFLKRATGSKEWSPTFKNFPGSEISTVFETAGGTLFVSTSYRLYKSTNDGKSWKQVYMGGSVGKFTESNGVLLATNPDGILRSADDGENWEPVLSEGGVGIDVEPIKDGFAAIVANRQMMARTVSTSYDGGKTWQPIDDGLKAELSIASIIQVGDNLFCGHPSGIFKSSDKGKTWKLILPSIKDKVFNLIVFGNEIYAIPRGEGC